MGGDEKREESALGTTGDGGVSALGADALGADALGSFGTGARARFGPTMAVEGTVTGRWVDDAVQNGQPPSIRATAYVNRETARKLLHGMVLEFRAQAKLSDARGYATDADNFRRWEHTVLECLGLTLGGG